MSDEEDLSDAMVGMTFDAPRTDPEAQAVVTDFLDYTEYLPSDLFRSLTLIGKLDKIFKDATDKVHELTALYAKLPSLPPNERPNPQDLRRDISIALNRAISCREASFTESDRLYKGVERHGTRLTSIKLKLQALPTPPSRDPTPPPRPATSPQSTRSRKPELQRTQRLKLTVDSDKSRKRKVLVPGEVLSANEATEDIGDSADELDGSTDELDGSPNVSATTDRTRQADSRDPNRSPSAQMQRTPKPPKTRPPGSMGTNVHSAIAGISTSNALALLTPPPVEAQPGSRHRPWFKLTEYEMAALRKSMKKNAIWTPSDAMIRRELHRDARGFENFERARASAAARGEPYLDEDPTDPGKTELAPGEVSWTQSTGPDEAALVNRGMRLNEAKKHKKELMAREQAERDAVELDEANKKIAAAGDQFKTLFSRDQRTSALTLTSAAGSDKRAGVEASRTSRKRKRGSEKETDARETPVHTPTPDSSTHSGPKRLKISVPPLATSKRASKSSSPTKSNTSRRTTTVPLAPPGSSSSPTSAASRRAPTSAASTATSAVPSTSKKPAPPIVIPTAAQSRPRREYAATKSAADTLTTMASTRLAVRELKETLVSRPRPRRVISVAKAASAEPAPSKRELRDSRRASAVASTVPSTPTLAAPRSTRSGRRPAPGLVTADENGKSKVSVGKRKAAPRTKASANTRRDGPNGGGKENEQPAEEAFEDVDPDEPRYCICGDVSFGTMIACENDECEKEWFHLDCIGLPEIPPRRSKWYCADCYKELGNDEKGNVRTADEKSGRRR